MEQTEYDARYAKMEAWWSALRHELVEILAPEEKSIVYHYTDINGLLGMITSGRIWATHVSRLNDASEYHHGFRVVMESINRFKPRCTTPVIDKIINAFRQKETYVASYSVKQDLLSQWRAYSGNGIGYCLGLEVDGIATLDYRTPLLEPVIYGDGQARRLIFKMLDGMENFFRNSEFCDVELGYILGTYSATLANLACTIKHPTFKEEAEYRQFYQPGETKLQLDLKFRNGRFGLTPYVEMPFPEKGRLPLKTIMIGPCMNFDVESMVVKELLKSYSYEDVNVIRSMIPLRM